MGRDDIDRVWAAAEYGPTAQRLEPVATVVADRFGALCPAPVRVLDLGAGHGGLAARLADDGHEVIALEPVAQMRRRGVARTGRRVTWVDAVGESTGLAEGSVDGIVSNFGAFLCDPRSGPREWARVLSPGGVLLMTAWDTRGFLAEMTTRMMAVLHPDGGGPGHMSWGHDDFARSTLEPWFSPVEIAHLEVPWRFGSVAEGMRLYEEGSPTHAFSFDVAGERREELAATLEQHLREHADPQSGTIESSAGYSLITARRRCT